jgi:Ca2+-transporting ATPase
MLKPSKSIANDYSSLTPTETAARLKTSLTSGLTSAEAFKRLQDTGPNELPHEPPEPLWLSFLKQFKEPLILLLLASAVASLVVGSVDDAISIAIAVTIVVSVAFIQEYRSEKSLEALNHLVPNHAHLIRGETGLAPPSRVPGWSNGLPETASQEIDTLVPDEAAVESASVKVMAAQLVPGDLVLFTTGDRIPADIRVTKATDLTIDESNLTGENEPVRIIAEAKQPSRNQSESGSYGLEPPPSPSYASAGTGTVGADTQLNSRNNIAFMGTLVRSGYGQGIVFATGGQTHFGTIAASVSETESPRSPLQLSMDALGRQLSQASFGIIGVISLIGWLQGKKVLDIFTISISLAVAAIPEGLPIIVTVTLALGVHRMARHHAIVRKMPSVETLGSVNVVCSDKTGMILTLIANHDILIQIGTLTMNHMTTTKMWYFDADRPLDVDSDDEATESQPDAVALRILRIGNIANNARLTNLHSPSAGSASSRTVLSSTQNNHGPNDYLRSRWVGQPTDVAMLDLLDRFREHDVRDGLGPRIGETPFSSERKWMGVTISYDSGRDIGANGQGEKEIAYIKGALDRVLDRCDTYLTRESREVVLDAARRQEALQAAEKLAEEGLRVLGFASGPVPKTSRSRSLQSTPRSNTPIGRKTAELHEPTHDEDVYRGLTFAGIVGMSDPPRFGVTKSISRLMRGGVKVIMITGDAETTAVAIAKKLGMAVATPREHTSSSVAVRPVLRGDQLDEMSDDELTAAIRNTSIFARTSPDHKMRIITALQAKGDIVAMTGDGVNDAPALKKADIGISMGLQGTDVAKEAADMILTDDDFSTILRAIEEGKGIFSNIQNFLTFQLSTSAAALSLVFLCTCLGYQNPLNAMQILWISKCNI